MNDDYMELFQSAKAKCENCSSQNLLLFTETRIQNCVAWACYDCQSFEIRAKPEILKEFFKSNDTK
jgi:hypothetical protein